MQAPEILAAVAAKTSNAILVTGPDGLIEWVNAGFTNLTGYALDEVHGRRPSTFLHGPATSPEARAAMRDAIHTGSPFNTVVLNYSRSGTPYWVRIDAEPNYRDGELCGFIAVQTDVTQDRIREASEGVLQAIGRRLMQSESIPEGAAALLEELVRNADIQAATLWLVDENIDTLLHAAGRAKCDAAKAWVDQTRALRFRRGLELTNGVDAPGLAWGTGERCNLTEFSVQDSDAEPSRRREAARSASIQAVCAVPIHGADGVVAVIEVGGSHRYPGHEQLPSLLERVGEYFEGFLARHRCADAFTSLFQHSPDALVVTTRTGTVRRANHAAQLLLGDVVGRELIDVLRVQSPRAKPDPLEPHPEDEWHVETPKGHIPVDIRIAPVQLTNATRVLIALRDQSTQKGVELALRESLDTKHALLHEINHRVKNNLQIISSLIALESSQQSDPKAFDALAATRDRIRSIALVHHQLYAADQISEVHLDAYLERLCIELQQALLPDAELVFQMEPLQLSLDRSVSVGIAINELLTNAFKYGASADGRTHVEVSLRTERHLCILEIADRGPGQPEDTPAGALGQRVVRALVRQLRGTLAITNTQAVKPDVGTRATLSFEL